MDRYGKYFLQHILWLDDGFNKYYVQDKAWGRQEILDVESVIFDWDDDAEQWLSQCVDHHRTDTISHLRSFLANDCAERYLVHQMTDRQVLRAVARQMTQNVYQIVIKPRLGWAVQVDADSATPALPLRVEPEPDLDYLLAGLKTDLDDLVAEQQKQYDQYEARMRGMNAAQKALFIKQQMDGAAYDTAIGDNLDLIKAAPGAIWSAAKAFPGFYKGYLKFLWKVAQLPSKMAGLAVRAVATGDINPLKAEIDKIVTPVASTYEEAMEYKSMLTILCSEPEVYELLYDFADRYYEATHPIELAKMGTSAVTEVLITVLLAIFTAGAGAAANVAAKSGKLVKVFKLLKKITITIKRISPNPKLLDRSKNAAQKAKKRRKAAAKRAKGMPDVDSPKKTEKLDKKDKKEYGDDKNDGSKKPEDVDDIEKDRQKIDKKEIQSRIRGKLKTKPLRKMYKGEEVPNNPDNWLGGHGHVKYLTDAELSQHKVTIQNGKLYDANGNLFDTSKANTWDGKKRAIFIVDEKGDMYVSNYQKAMEFHHSSLGQGKPVAMAGEIEVTNGKLNYMSNRSGHYHPTKEFMDQSIEHLSEQGLDFSSVKIHLE